MRVVKDIQVKKQNIGQLVEQLDASGGFIAKKLAQGVDILKQMIKDKNCTKFLSFPACIVSTGTRGVLAYIVKNRLADVVITTCGTLDHDFARIWKDYLHGSFEADDKELHKKGINRLGNIFIPTASYGEILEDKIVPILNKLYSEGKRELSSKELVWELGKALDKEKKKEESIIYWAWKNKIPVFVPGLTDGAVGSQLWAFREKHSDFKIDLLKDEQELANIIFDSKKLGALMIGGGISKHHTIWWAQFKNGLDYAVYITTAVEWTAASAVRRQERQSAGES